MKLPKASLPRHLLAALAITATVGAFAKPAEACGGGWWPEIQIDHRVQGIARAERDLAAGRYHAAAGSVIRMIPHIRGYQHTTGDHIVNRALRVLAVATARTGGQLNLEKQIPRQLHSWLGKDADERQASLAWSVQALKAVSKLKKKAPAVQSELAEAMAQLPAHRDSARTALEKLAKKDLLSTPQGYATLADLRAKAGDDDGRLAALQRCKTMAKDDRVCRAAETATGHS